MPPRVQQIAGFAVRVCPNARTATATTPAPIGPSRSLLIAFQSLAIHTSAPSTAQFQSKGAYNPYAIARSKAIREHNIARQAELREQRAASNVDPVLGKPTPFTAELDAQPTPLPSIDHIVNSRMSLPQLDKLESQVRPNFFLTREEIKDALKKSKELTFPPPPKGVPEDMLDPERLHNQFAQDAHAREAIKRITSLALGSSKDRTRENKQHCIETFGRHNTDLTLPKDPPQLHSVAANLPKQFEKTPRVGPDTGSSEVQAAILTAKIRALAEHLKTAKKDKMNKRNLRLLCHKRQKILKYLKRKEKGGVRYRNVMEKLGLDENAIFSELMM
ncbi:hypothetical protein EV426DRAFT_609328 [Tirmania nivea]|nr:hypothetical protein EV426DRAFT_609328 [Tirmania nivea]